MRYFSVLRKLPSISLKSRSLPHSTEPKQLAVRSRSFPSIPVRSGNVERTEVVCRTLEFYTTPSSRFSTPILVRSVRFFP